MDWKWQRYRPDGSSDISVRRHPSACGWCRQTAGTCPQWRWRKCKLWRWPSSRRPPWFGIPKCPAVVLSLYGRIWRSLCSASACVLSQKYATCSLFRCTFTMFYTDDEIQCIYPPKKTFNKVRRKPILSLNLIWERAIHFRWKFNKLFSIKIIEDTDMMHSKFGE